MLLILCIILLTFSSHLAYFIPISFYIFLHIVLHGSFKHFTHSSFDNLPCLPTHFTCSGILVILLSGFLQDQILDILPFFCWSSLRLLGTLKKAICVQLFTLEIYVWDLSKLWNYRYSELLNKCTARKTSSAEFLGYFYFSQRNSGYDALASVSITVSFCGCFLVSLSIGALCF